MDFPAPLLVRVLRDGVVESVHRGHVVVCDAAGDVRAWMGDPQVEIYPRSALKPFQCAATLTLLDEAGVLIDVDAIAVATASHSGGDLPQIEAAYLLALAGLDESALRCPPALARDEVVRAAMAAHPAALAHNCSGKHAAFLLAQASAGAPTARYLDVDSPVQRRVVDALRTLCATQPAGPGVDGCGAPAWRMPLAALATGFARLAEGRAPAPYAHAVARVREAMAARPDLVGPSGQADVELMRSDGRVLAKVGAEAVLGAGMATGRGALGIAVKIADGSPRADGPVVAAVLEGLGAVVPPAVRHPVVLGGTAPHGALVPVAELAALSA